MYCGSSCNQSASPKGDCDSRWRGEKPDSQTLLYTFSRTDNAEIYHLFFWSLFRLSVFEFLNLIWIHERRTDPKNLLHDIVSHDTPAQRTIIPSLVTKGSAIQKTSAELRTVWKRRWTWPPVRNSPCRRKATLKRKVWNKPWTDGPSDSSIPHPHHRNIMHKWVYAFNTPYTVWTGSNKYYQKWQQQKKWTVCSCFDFEIGQCHQKWRKQLKLNDIAFDSYYIYSV